MPDSGEEWKDGEEKPSGDVEYGMVWRFVDQSPAFTLGVEAGMIFERMQRREAVIESTVHAENDEDLRNLANTYGYHAKFDALGEAGTWLSAKFSRET